MVNAFFTSESARVLTVYSIGISRFSFGSNVNNPISEGRIFTLLILFLLISRFNVFESVALYTMSMSLFVVPIYIVSNTMRELLGFMNLVVRSPIRWIVSEATIVEVS